MPKNTACDPITDQEIAFAHLILSGTMTDRRAAEAVGLNPDTAAYTKAKPRVRAYMIEHRAAVKEKLVDQEAEGLRKLNIGRDQVLDRLWELAALSHEQTRGSIAGQIKALAMIAAIEGLIPDRRFHHTPRNPRPRPSNRISTSLSGSATRRANPWVRRQAIPLPSRKPNPPRPSLLPSRPPTWLTKHRLRTLTRPNPASLIPSSTPGGKTGFPPRQTAAWTPFLTPPTFQAALFPKTFLGAAPLKSPKKVKFYRILQKYPMAR